LLVAVIEAVLEAEISQPGSTIAPDV
jgi:hypothetical protein